MRRFMILCFALFQSAAHASSCPGSFDCPPCYRNWSALFYLGKMTNNEFGQIARADVSFAKETLYSLEIAKELDPCNGFRRFFQPITSFVDVRLNGTLLQGGEHPAFELNPYFSLNWNRFPWCHCVKTTFTIGEGISYVSRVPATEKRNSDEPKKLLNLLLFEVGFAAPNHPEWELVARVHHRSGAFGLYHANNSGSTAIGLALRYHFSV